MSRRFSSSVLHPIHCLRVAEALAFSPPPPLATPRDLLSLNTVCLSVLLLSFLFNSIFTLWIYIYAEHITYCSSVNTLNDQYLQRRLYMVLIPIWYLDLGYEWLFDFTMIAMFFLSFLFLIIALYDHCVLVTQWWLHLCTYFMFTYLYTWSPDCCTPILWPHLFECAMLGHSWNLKCCQLYKLFQLLGFCSAGAL